MTYTIQRAVKSDQPNRNTGIVYNKLEITLLRHIIDHYCKVPIQLGHSSKKPLVYYDTNHICGDLINLMPETGIIELHGPYEEQLGPIINSFKLYFEYICSDPNDPNTDIKGIKAIIDNRGW